MPDRLSQASWRPLPHFVSLLQRRGFCLRKPLHSRAEEIPDGRPEEGELHAQGHSARRDRRESYSWTTEGRSQKTWHDHQRQALAGPWRQARAQGARQIDTQTDAQTDTKASGQASGQAGVKTFPWHKAPPETYPRQNRDSQAFAGQDGGSQSARCQNAGGQGRAPQSCGIENCASKTRAGQVAGDNPKQNHHAP